jgi:hypothetical protein
MNLMKEVTDLYNENCISLKKKNQNMEGDPMLMEQQNQYCKNDYMTKSNLYVQSNTHQNSKDIFHRDRKISPKVHIESQKTSSSQIKISKKNNCGSITTSDFKVHYRTIVIKTVWYWHKSRQDQWTQTKPMQHGYLIFNKGVPNLYIFICICMYGKKERTWL